MVHGTGRPAGPRAIYPAEQLLASQTPTNIKHAVDVLSAGDGEDKTGGGKGLARSSSLPKESDRAAATFRAYDVDSKGLDHSDMVAALAEMVVIHGMPSSTIDDVLAVDPTVSRDKRYSLQEFLVIYERLIHHQSKIAREDRIKSISVHSDPPAEAYANPKLRAVFVAYSRFTAGVSRMLISEAAPMLVGQQVHRLFLDIGLTGDGGPLAPAAVDIAFARTRTVGSRRLSYPQFLKVLSILSDESGWDLFQIVMNHEGNLGSANFPTPVDMATVNNVLPPSKPPEPQLAPNSLLAKASKGALLPTIQGGHQGAGTPQGSPYQQKKALARAAMAPSPPDAAAARASVDSSRLSPEHCRSPRHSLGAPPFFASPGRNPRSSLTSGGTPKRVSITSGGQPMSSVPIARHLAGAFEVQMPMMDASNPPPWLAQILERLQDLESKADGVSSSAASGVRGSGEWMQHVDEQLDQLRKAPLPERQIATISSQLGLQIAPKAKEVVNGILGPLEARLSEAVATAEAAAAAAAQAKRELEAQSHSRQISEMEAKIKSLENALASATAASGSEQESSMATLVRLQEEANAKYLDLEPRVRRCEERLDGHDPRLDTHDEQILELFDLLKKMQHSVAETDKLVASVHGSMEAAAAAATAASAESGSARSEQQLLQLQALSSELAELTKLANSNAEAAARASQEAQALAATGSLAGSRLEQIEKRMEQLQALQDQGPGASGLAAVEQQLASLGAEVRALQQRQDPQGPAASGLSAVEQQMSSLGAEVQALQQRLEQQAKDLVAAASAASAASEAAGAAAEEARKRSQAEEAQLLKSQPAPPPPEAASSALSAAELELKLQQLATQLQRELQAQVTQLQAGLEAQGQARQSAEAAAASTQRQLSELHAHVQALKQQLDQQAGTAKDAAERAEKLQAEVGGLRAAQAPATVSAALDDANRRLLELDQRTNQLQQAMEAASKRAAAEEAEARGRPAQLEATTAAAAAAPDQQALASQVQVLQQQVDKQAQELAAAVAALSAGKGPGGPDQASALVAQLKAELEAHIKSEQAELQKQIKSEQAQLEKQIKAEQAELKEVIRGEKGSLETQINNELEAIKADMLDAKERSQAVADHGVKVAKEAAEGLELLQQALGDEVARGFKSVNDRVDRASGAALAAQADSATVAGQFGALSDDLARLQGEVTGLKLKVDSKLAGSAKLASLESFRRSQNGAAAAGAPAPQADLSAVDARLEQVDAEMEQLAMALGEVVGRYTAFERDLGKSLEGFARVIDLKETENHLLERQEQLHDEVEVVKANLAKLHNDMVKISAATLISNPSLATDLPGVKSVKSLRLNRLPTMSGEAANGAGPQPEDVAQVNNRVNMLRGEMDTLSNQVGEIDMRLTRVEGAGAHRMDQQEQVLTQVVRQVEELTTWSRSVASSG